MNRLACQYAIIRFLPYAETGEFANVGVVLTCPETGFLDARLMPTKKTGRITAFFDQLDKKIYRDTLGYVDDEVQRIRKMTQAAGHRDVGTLVKQTFAGLTRPRESLLRFSDTRVILAEDPGATLQQLFARFVERDFVNKQYHERILERDVRQVLARADLRQYFGPEVIGNDDLHVQIPFVHLHDGKPSHAIKPLDLARDEANQVYEHGGHWADRIRRLRKHALLPGELLFAVNSPEGTDLAIRRAADEILDDLRGYGVVVVEATDARAITEFAARVRH